jgi:WD40 repeat protein
MRHAAKPKFRDSGQSSSLSIEEPSSNRDLFLSYNRLDRKAVYLVHSRLRSIWNINAWRDEEALPGDRAWVESIRQQIGTIPAAALVLGPHGWGPSQSVEVRAILQRKETDPSYRVICVLLPGADPEMIRELGPEFAAKQWADYRGGVEGAQAEFVDGVMVSAVMGWDENPVPEEVRQIQELKQRAGVWVAVGRKDESLLYRGALLSRMEELAARRVRWMSPDASALLVASAEDERQRGVRQKRAAWITAIASVIALAVIALFGIQWRIEKKAADRNADRADKNALAQKIEAARADSEAKEAITQRELAENSKAESQRELRTALGHQFAGAAVNAAGTSAGLLFALNAVAVTRDRDHIVLPDAEDALLKTVDAMLRSKAISPTEFKRPGHTSPVQQITFSRDATRLATVANDGVRIWDLTRGEEILSFSQKVPCQSFSQDLRALACNGGPPGTPAGFFNLETNEQLLSVSCPICPISQMGFSPDGKLLVWADHRGVHAYYASSSGTHVSGGSPSAPFFSEAMAAATEQSRGGPPIGRAKPTTFTFLEGAKHFEGRNFAFSPDSKLLATIVDGAVKVWDVASGNRIATWDGKADLVEFSPDGRQVAISGDADAYRWELATGKTSSLQFPRNNQSVECVAFSPDGSRLAVLGTLLWQVTDIPAGKVWVHSTGGVSRRLQAETCGFQDQPLTSGRRQFLLVVNGRYYPDRKYRSEVWDIDSDRLNTSEDLLAQWSGDGQWVARADSDYPLVSLTNVRTGAMFYLPGRAEDLRAVGLAPDAARIVMSGSDGIARVWDVQSGRKLLSLIGVEQRISSATYSPDGTRIVTAGTDPMKLPKVSLWDAYSGRRLRDLAAVPRSTRTILTASFTVDSKRILASGIDQDPSNGWAVLIGWDAATGRVLPEIFPFLGHLNSIVPWIAWSADGKRLALAGLEARVWDVTAAREILPGPGPTNAPTGITALSRDGRYLAMAEASGVRIWSQNAGWKELSGSSGGAALQPAGVAFSRDGKRLVAPGIENTLRIWDTATAKEVGRVYYDAREQRNLTPPRSGPKLLIRAVSYSPDEKQIYGIGNNWAVYRFPVPLEDPEAEARRLATELQSTLDDDVCDKYLHQKPCPEQLRRIP